MKITKRQLRRVIRETMLNEALPPHLQKHFRKDGSSVHQSQIKDVTPIGYGPNDTPATDAYETGFDDALQHMDPMNPEDEDYMQGWRDGRDEMAPKPDEGIRRRGW